MRILVTGCNGQVARSLQQEAVHRPDIELLTIGRPELDLAQPRSVHDAIVGARPDIIVSAAAYTAVDQAEEAPEMARAINARGAQAVALAALNSGAPLIHLSTDYVFPGNSTTPYTEADIPRPRNVYGRTKLEGEQLVGSANPRCVIMRTAWIYSPFGTNFMKTMLALARQCDSVSVVADQWGNPTSALDLARAILHVAGILRAKAAPEMYGLYHVTGSGETNWSGFARAIFEESSLRGGPTAIVTDISAPEYPTKAERPANSRLCCHRFATTFGWQMPHWRISVAEAVDQAFCSGVATAAVARLQP